MLTSQPRWPLQLRMPSRDIQEVSDAPYGVSPTLLKRHKTLPHPREGRFSDTYSTTLSSKPRVLSVDTGIPSSPTSQSSSPRTLKHASRRIGVPDLPPTPPTHSRQSSSGSALPENIRGQDAPPKSPSIPTTPTNHQSPPTPDVTPPRGTALPLVSRPPITERYPSSGFSSSRNDSFKTAREDFSSEDEDEVSTVRPILPSARPSQVEIPKANPVKSREVGLGLGLESENESTPSLGNRKKDRKISTANPIDEFVTFDGQWSSTGEVSEVEREWDHNLMRNVTVRKRPARDSFLYNGNLSGEVLDDIPVTPTNATKLLRKYPILDTFSTRPTSLELGQRNPSRGVATSSESPTTPDIRRFSAMSARSGTSTVVEAMVVETPPQRRKTLRHTKKQMGLRELSSDHSTYSSTADPVFPNLPHRLVHKSSGIFNRKHESLGSTATASTSSSARSRRAILNNGGIPVVIIPERRSSTKSAHTPSLRSNSSRTKRSLSLSSAPLSQSAKANNPGYVDLPNRNPRRLSESGASSDAHSQRTIDFPPVIPIRRSSLSAPTSRNTSRAGSLTAESLRAHNILQAATEKPDQLHVQSLMEPQKDSTHLAPRASVDQNGDPFFGNRLSTQVTPFSQASYETNGTAAEVAQATSVALYPHNNESLLVIEQQAQSSATPLQTSMDAIEHAKAAANDTVAQDPVTPPQQQRQEIDEVDSPLRNPRDAPQPPAQPPAIQFIPPTPNVLTPTQEENRELGQDIRPSTADQKPKRGLSLIRRALSNRRRSDSVTKRKFLTKRTKEATDEMTETSKQIASPITTYPSVIDQPADESKLHPFWRPARFWDDLEEDDDEQYIDRDPYPPIDNRPSLPKRSLSNSLKRTFAILPIRDESEVTIWAERRVVRRTGSGSLRVVKNRGSSGSLRRAVSDGRAYYTSESSRILPDSSEIRKVWTGFKGIGRRVSEKRRERRNEELRKTISGPKDAVDGVARVIASEGMGGFRSNSNGTIRRRPVPQRELQLNTVPTSQE